VHAGPLRHRVEIMMVNETRDASGGASSVLSFVARRWASVQPLSGKERLSAGTVRTENIYRVLMRGDAVTRALTAANVIQANGKALDIETISSRHDMGHDIELVCTERAQ
jgi:SPP1 family predicted phage head-tail adaptor